MILRLRVQPRAKRNALVSLRPGEWKLQLMAPPVEGQANRAGVNFFARGLEIVRSRVRIVSGEKSPQKVLELEGISEEEFLRFAGGGPP